MYGEDAHTAVKPLIAVCFIYIVFDIVFVALRFVSRRFVKRSELGWDDYLIIPGFIFNVAACILGLRKWTGITIRYPRVPLTLNE